jgi:hypothetical protein
LANTKQIKSGTDMSIWLLIGLYLYNTPLYVQTNTAGATVALATTPLKVSFAFYDIKGRLVHSGYTPFVGNLPPGRYRLLLEKDKYFSEQRSLTLHAGQQKILQIELLPESAPHADPASPTVPAPHTPKTQPQPTGPSPKVADPSSPPPRTDPPQTATTIPSSLPHTSQEKQSKPEAPRPTPPPISSDPPSTQPASGVAHKSSDSAPKPAARNIPWIPLGAAVALAVAGGIFWAISSNNLEASKDRNRFQIDAYQDYQQARSHRSTATFLLAGGGVAIGLAAMFYFWPPSTAGLKKRIHPPDSPVMGFSFEVSH